MRHILSVRLCTVLLPLFLGTGAGAQLTTLPRGGNKRAFVGEQIGLTDITIRYNRPGVKGREGHIWGELIPVGFTELGYGFKKPTPWRAGANENTTIEFSTEVKIEGQDLPAGKYGFFIAYGPDESILIFSHNASSWGNFFYDASEDALRVKVRTRTVDSSAEWLKYEFTNQSASGATIRLQWEKVAIPFRVEVDVIKTQLASFRKELRGDKALPGLWQPWNQAAAFCAAHNTNLEEGLMWADSSLSVTFGGDVTFTAWQTKAAILDSMGRKSEALDIMKKALPLATAFEAYNYGQGLIGTGHPKEAFDVLKTNYAKFSDNLFGLIGMASGYSALGDFRTALVYAQKALPLAKGGNRTEILRNIRDLQAGKDMN